MERWVHFRDFHGPGWPSPSQLEHYFLTPSGRRQAFETGNDCWGLSAIGVHGTENLAPDKGRIDLGLTMLGNPEHGVLLHYRKGGGGYKDSFYSKRDLRRLREWVKTAHDDLFPVGLYIPFETAWKAVKEFIETDGQLPRSIEWVADDDLPADAFPEP
jgi:hypothetical protein